MEAVLPLSLTTAFLFCLLLLVTCRLLGGLLSPLDLNFTYWYQSHRFSSVQFSHSVVSDFLPPREPQHTRLPCPSPTPGVHPNLCLLSWWCHLPISSSVVPFSSWPQSRLWMINKVVSFRWTEKELSKGIITLIWNDLIFNSNISIVCYVVSHCK